MYNSYVSSAALTLQRGSASWWMSAGEGQGLANGGVLLIDSKHSQLVQSQILPRQAKCTIKLHFSINICMYKRMKRKELQKQLLRKKKWFKSGVRTGWNMETAVRVAVVQHQANPQLCGCVPPSPTYRPVCCSSVNSWVLFPRLWRAETQHENQSSSPNSRRDNSLICWYMLCLYESKFTKLEELKSRLKWAKTTNKSMVHKGYMGRTHTQKNSHPTSRKSTWLKHNSKF